MGVYFKSAGKTSYADEVEPTASIKGVLGIDKIAVVAQVPETELVHYADYKAKINFATKSGFDVRWDGRASRNGYKNSLRLLVGGGDAKSYPLFQFDPFNPKQGYMRLEFNPNGLGPAGVENLKWWVDNTSPHGWSTFREWGNITRIDVNLDVSASISDFIWDSQYYVSRERYKANGRLESIYLGNKEWGKNYTRIYDWNACHDPSALTSKTRIERKQSPKCGLKELSSMKNAFDGARLYHATIPTPEGFTYGAWRLYLNHVAQVGLRNSLFDFELDKREDIKKHIQSYKVSNLNFEEIWKTWPSVVEKLGLATPGPNGALIPFLNSDIPKDLLG